MAPLSKRKAVPIRSAERTRPLRQLLRNIRIPCIASVVDQSPIGFVPPRGALNLKAGPAGQVDSDGPANVDAPITPADGRNRTFRGRFKASRPVRARTGSAAGGGAEKKWWICQCFRADSCFIR
jgi:hypothetical protein